MHMTKLIPDSLRTLKRDACVLFLSRFIRLFAYGESQVGILLTLTLVGDLAISLALTTRADRLGRRATLIVGIVGAVLMRLRA
jgi:MFS family permease